MTYYFWGVFVFWTLYTAWFMTKLQKQQIKNTAQIKKIKVSITNMDNELYTVRYKQSKM